MSGHLLSTVNPEAASAIQPALQPPPPPPVGSLVLYHMRQGHGRMGRTAFPALVMGEAGRHLSLCVIIDAGDMVDEERVPEYGIGNEFHAWERLEDGRAVAEGLRGTIAALHVRVGELEQVNADMARVVLGEFNPPNVSIIHIMQDFEQRLAVVARRLGEVEASRSNKVKPLPTPRQRNAARSKRK